MDHEILKYYLINNVIYNKICLWNYLLYIYYRYIIYSILVFSQTDVFKNIFVLSLSCGFVPPKDMIYQGPSAYSGTPSRRWIKCDQSLSTDPAVRNYVTICLLGKTFSRRLFFFKRSFLCFIENIWLLRTHFAWNVTSYFLGKIRKISPVCHLLNLSIAC